MMRRQSEPARLFCDFCLDDHIPYDDMLRGIDRFFDCGDIRRTATTGSAKAEGPRMTLSNNMELRLGSISFLARP
jgi:transposase